MPLLFLFRDCLSLSHSNGFRSGGDGSTKDQRNCVSCSNTKSWTSSGSECHARANMAIKLSETENDCEKVVYARYDKDLAYKMVFLSAIAYSDDVAKYIQKANEVDSFHLVKQVTKPCGGNALCSGFVAVSHSEKAIAIAFRGTQHFRQLITEILQLLVEPERSFTQVNGQVQGYFLDTFNAVWNDLQHYVYEEMKKYPSYNVWVTGHSLGGALASLASTLIMFQGKTTKDNLILYTFGQPKVGDYDYALTHDELVPQSFRVTHYRDVVVHLPTCKTITPGNPCILPGVGPCHHGKEIHYGSEIMTKDSPYKVCEGLAHCTEGLGNNRLAWSKCISTNILQCIDNHKRYFGISVGQWWKNILITN